MVKKKQEMASPLPHCVTSHGFNNTTTTYTSARVTSPLPQQPCATSHGAATATTNVTSPELSEKKLSRRRHSSDSHDPPNITSPGSTPDQRRASFSNLRPVVNWSEYGARRSIVKFRSRNTLKLKSPRARIGRNVTVPSPVQEVLREQYNLASSTETNAGERVLAVVYCCFFGWMDSFHSLLTRRGRRPSRLAWALSCVLVTAVALSLLLLVFLLTNTITLLLFYLAQAGLKFITFILIILITLLGVTAIFRYDLSPSSTTHVEKRDNPRNYYQLKSDSLQKDSRYKSKSGRKDHEFKIPGRESFTSHGLQLGAASRISPESKTHLTPLLEEQLLVCQRAMY